MKYSGIPVIIIMFMLFSACSIKPKPIVEGVDTCENCKMTVMEKKYASEIVTVKGRTYIFDDLKCLNQFLSENKLPKEEIKLILVTDFYHPDIMIEADKAIFYYAENLHTPMNGKSVALSDSGDFVRIQTEYPGESKTLSEIIK